MDADPPRAPAPPRAGAVPAPAGRPAPASKPAAADALGVVIHSYGIRSREPSRATSRRSPTRSRFLEFCRELGAGGVQVALGARDTDDAAESARRGPRSSGCTSKASSRLPKDEADLDRFDAEVRDGEATPGPTVLRTVMLWRPALRDVRARPTTFRALRRARRWQSLQLAEPVVGQARGPAGGREPQGLPGRRAGRPAQAARQRLRRRLRRHRQQHRPAGGPARRWSRRSRRGRSRRTSRTWASRSTTDGFLLSEVPLGDGLPRPEADRRDAAEGRARRSGSTWR